jgi:hypothetical protein
MGANFIIMATKKARKPSVKKPLGYILYQGESLYDGSPIAVIATGFDSRSTNEKTGDMIQTYILRTDVSPVLALKTGQDVGICGDCRHRPILAKKTGEARCYVNVGQGARSVYQAFKRGRYAPANVSDIAPLLRGRKVRFGTYGDPAVAPVQVFADLAKAAEGHTGYTHRWRDQSFDVAAWSPLVMASVDDLWEQQTAKALGLRYFRVTIGVTELLDREVRCPASAEMGKRTTCVSCTLCAGTSVKAKSVVIADHGLGWKSRAKA